jgi:transposase-like protein
MTQPRKSSTEFKREAVQLIWDSNLSIRQVATARGLHVNKVSRWGREQPRDWAKEFRDQTTPRDEELARLK